MEATVSPEDLRLLARPRAYILLGEFSTSEPSINYGSGETTSTIPEAIPNYRDIHSANLSRVTAGTGRRLPEWEEYCQWLVPGEEPKTMWGTGMPGAGKTIFAYAGPQLLLRPYSHSSSTSAIIIKEVELHAKANPRICVAFIYFRYSDHTKATVRDFLAVLVKQTIERHPDCFAISSDLYRRHIRERTQPSEEEHLELLHSFSRVMEVTFYFLDALDEAPPDVQFDLLEKLSSLNVKLFITSRPLLALEARFPSAHRFEIHARDLDLNLHINKEISRSILLQTILDQGGPALHKKITLIVKEKCGGMFLHASLQLDALRDCTSIFDVEKTLEEFPRRIEEVYERTWNRVLHQTPHIVALARKVLVWFEKRRLVDGATLMGLCRGLVNVEEKTNLVRFVHYTAKDVVKALVSESSPYPHSLPALVCITLLTEHGFRRTTLGDEDDLKTALSAEPLLAYAYQHWSIHAHESLRDPTVAGQISQFIQGCCAFPEGLLDIIPAIYDMLEPLHMAAYFDFPLSIAGSAYLRNPNRPTRHQGQTPLTLAIRRNSLTAMRELLSLPPTFINAADKDGVTPLIRALKWKNTAGVALLLAHPQVYVNAQDQDGESALMRAFSAEEVTLLLAHPKIKPNQVDSRGRTALMLASLRELPEVVQVLLADPRVKIDLKSKDGETALDIAQGRVERAYRKGEWDVSRIHGLKRTVELLSIRADQEHRRHKLGDFLRHVWWSHRYDLVSFHRVGFKIVVTRISTTSKVSGQQCSALLACLSWSKSGFKTILRQTQAGSTASYLMTQSIGLLVVRDRWIGLQWKLANPTRQVLGRVGILCTTKPPDVDAERSSRSISNSISLSLFTNYYNDNTESAVRFTWNLCLSNPYQPLSPCNEIEGRHARDLMEPSTTFSLGSDGHHPTFHALNAAPHRSAQSSRKLDSLFVAASCIGDRFSSGMLGAWHLSASMSR
ncbi:hypothetical protein BKA70DRAFT_1235417 [Coprinopsis sp. MPI-PUGE-AT-0042]|nr:hypothetical protein BKA70DRAFT_1235417 [Coprinopsis sp. MPI-PUGE-AT-0042]